MEALDVIRGRNSTRAFLPKPVSKEIITEVLDAARWTPSGSNGQRWRVTVAAGAACETLQSQLADRARARKPQQPGATGPAADASPSVTSLRAHLARVAQDLGQSYWEFVVVGSNALYGAPVVVVVSHPGKNSGDATRFVTTMLLAAHDLGLGTCWLGYPLRDADLIRQTLEIPDKETISAVIALGYPDTDAPANAFRSARNELETFVRWVGFD